MGSKLKGVLEEVKKVLKQAEAASEELPPETESEVDVEKLKTLVDNFKQKLVAQAGATSGPGINIHWAVLTLAFVVFFSLLGLFSYRLVQSLQERERKREEKRRLKEEKSKKKK